MRSGTFEAMWNLAATSGGTVKLLQNVTAENGSFGTAHGFENGAVKVPTTVRITLDLNGYTLDRHLTTAQDKGYVIFVAEKGIFTLQDSSGNNSGRITGGNTTGSGGGIYVLGYCNIYGGNITDNVASVSGGGIAAITTSKLQLYGGKISHNEAKIAGGGVFYSGTTGDVGFVMHDGEISDNTASGERCGGGGVYSMGQYSFIIKGGKIINNRTVGPYSHGGGVCVKENGYFSMSGGEISGNHAAGSGGGVYISMSDKTFSVSLTNGEISRNTADNDGGGICVGATTASISNIKITDNIAGGKGGGFYSGLAANDQTYKAATVASISGSPKIYGNRAGSNDNLVQNNLYLQKPNMIVNGQEIQYYQSLALVSSGTTALSTDAIIGITVQQPYDYDNTLRSIKLSSTGKTDYEKYVGVLFADNPESCRIEFDSTDNYIYYHEGEGQGGHTHAGNATVYRPVTGDDFVSGSIGTVDGPTYLYLTQSVTLDKTIQIVGNVDICLNSNRIVSPADGNPAFSVGSGASLRIYAESAQKVKELFENGTIKLEKDANLVIINSSGPNDVDAETNTVNANTSGSFSVADNKFVSDGGDEHRHNALVFVELPTAPDSLASGSYYLADDITLSSPITISGTVNLCLNGHQITGPADGKPAFQVPNGAVLNIYNDEGAGSFAGLSGSGGMEVAGGGTLKLVAKDADPVTYTPAGSSGVKVTVDQNGAVTDTPVEGGGDPTPDGPHAQRHPELAGATEINFGNFTAVTKENKPDGYTGALPAVTTAYRFLDPGKYYLEGDFTMPNALIALGNTDFCLNGSNLGADNDTWIYEMQHVFWVPEKAALNVLDCQRDLHIVWLYGGRVFLKKGAHVTISGNLPDYITKIEMAEDADGEVKIEYIEHDVNKEPVMTLPKSAMLTQKIPVKLGQTITQTITNRGDVLEMTTSETGAPTTRITPPSTEASINLKLPEPVLTGEAPSIVLEAPAGSTVQTAGGPAIQLEQPGEVAVDGTVSSPEVTVTTGDPAAGKEVQTTVTAPAGKTVQVTPSGEAQAPAGSTVQTAGGPEIQLEQPGEVAAGGAVSSRSVTVKTVDPETEEEVRTTVAAPADKTVQVTPDGEAQAPAGSTVTVDDVAVKVEKIGGGGAGSTVTVHPSGSVDLPAGSEAAVSSPKKDSVTIVIALPGEGGAGTLDMTGGGVTPPKGSTVTTKTKKGGVTIVIALPWPEGGEAPEIHFGGGGSLILPPGTQVTKGGKTETVTEDKNVLDPDTGELTDKEPENPDEPDKPGKPVNPNEPAGKTEEITPDKPIDRPDVKVEMDEEGKITVTPTDPQKPPVVIKPQPPDQPGDTPPKVDETGKVFIDTPFKVKTEDGPDITAEKGGSVDPDGNVTGETVTVEQKKPDGTTESTTLTAPENDAVKVGPNGEAQVPVRTEVKQDGVTVTIDKVPDPAKPVPVKPDGSINLPGGSQITVTPEQPQQPAYIVTIPDKGGEVKLDQDRPVITLPPGAKVVDPISGKETTISGSGGTINLSTGEITGAAPDGGGNDRPGSSGGSGGGSSPASYVITASASIGGEIFPDQRVTVRGGADQTFTITPAEGYVISDVLVDDESVGPVTSYTFRNVRSAHTIQALFAAEGTSGHGHPGGCPKDETCPIWPYTDSIPTDWYHDGVHYCIENGLMIGTAPVLWEPDIPLSRAMMAQVLYNKAGQPAVSGAGVFEDVEQCGYWPAITWGGRTGVLQGYGDGSYGPYDAITREQLATLLWRYAGQPASDGQLHFSDAAEVSDYARQALNWASRQGVITGYPDGTFRPRDNASRAEAAQMIMRYFEL